MVSGSLQHTFFKILRIFKFDTPSSVSDLSYLPDLAEIRITKDLVAGYLPSGQLKLMLPIQFLFLQTKCHDALVKLQPIRFQVRLNLDSHNLPLKK